MLLHLITALGSAASPPAPPAPFGLRLEHLASPVIGVESPHPQLSWKLAHAQRGATQAAYEVTVHLGDAASSSPLPLWSSGKRASNASEAIALFASPN
jgi:alpha-L-rhamnosidase